MPTKPLLPGIFAQPREIDALFAKILTPNDDSGKHGVLIPAAAYPLFPEFPDFDPDSGLNYTLPIHTIWQEDLGIPRRSAFKHYHRYPERRLTRLDSERLPVKGSAGILLVLGRRRGTDDLFEVRVYSPSDPACQVLWRELGFSEDPEPGRWFLDLDWSPDELEGTSPALRELIDIFDRISQRGWITTMRSGDTGIGYTFETLAGIPENNRRDADYKGIEIKTTRESELRPGTAQRRDLFLLAPRWTDGLSSHAERVRTYGYRDDERGRWGLYSTAQARQNSHGFRLRVDEDGGRIYLDHHGSPVAFWTRTEVARRLSEKHTETVIVTARSRGKGACEQFWYEGLLHCKDASVDSFFELVRRGAVMLELRMHASEAGTARDRGPAFRVRAEAVPELFRTVRQLR